MFAKPPWRWPFHTSLAALLCGCFTFPSNSAPVNSTGLGSTGLGSTGLGETDTPSDETGNTLTTSDSLQTSSESGGKSGSDTADSETTSDSEPYIGDPLPSWGDGDWGWVDFPDSKCRNGSPTGIGVRYGSGTGLVIFFENGLACFNTASCFVSSGSFGAKEFADFSQGANLGIYESDNSNPIANWTFVYIPYCTGDLHAGARPNGTVPDVAGTHHFVGYTNVGHYLQRVVPTFRGTTDRILVTGTGAGGFGAIFNYDRIASAFPNNAVTLLDDSGPLMASNFMTTCFQENLRDVWNLDATLPAECVECFAAGGGGLVNLGLYLGKRHKKQRFGLISSLGDQSVRLFFGFGSNECGSPGSVMLEEVYANGLRNLRDHWLDTEPAVWGTFLLPGTKHGWLNTVDYGTAESGGVSLMYWLTQLLAANVADVEP